MSTRSLGGDEPARPSRGRRRPDRVGAALVALLLVLVPACDDGGEDATPTPDASPQLPDHFPRDFPLPDTAVRAGGGDAPVFAVDDDPDVVLDFYRQRLPEAGWDVGEEWDGVDPRGRDAHGVIFRRGSVTGAVSITAGDRYASLVQATMREDPGDDDRAHEH